MEQECPTKPPPVKHADTITTVQLLKGCPMAKSEGRGWKRYVPSLPTVVKIFVVLVVLHAINRVVSQKLPANIVAHWPSV